MKYIARVSVQVPKSLFKNFSLRKTAIIIMLKNPKKTCEIYIFLLLWNVYVQVQYQYQYQL